MPVVAAERAAFLAGDGRARFARGGSRARTAFACAHFRRIAAGSFSARPAETAPMDDDDSTTSLVEISAAHCVPAPPPFVFAPPPPHHELTIPFLFSKLTRDAPASPSLFEGTLTRKCRRSLPRRQRHPTAPFACCCWKSSKEWLPTGAAVERPVPAALCLHGGAVSLRGLNREGRAGDDVRRALKAQLMTSKPFVMRF